MAVNPVTPFSSPALAGERIPIQTLGQDDFLKLLVIQMTSQDPMNPQKDTQFIAQMAQFSALEQSKAMQGDLAQLRTQQQFLQANVLIGQTVALQADPNSTVLGVVRAVQIVDGTPKLVVNGMPYDLDQVLTITPTPLQQ